MGAPDRARLARLDREYINARARLIILEGLADVAGAPSAQVAERVANRTLARMINHLDEVVDAALAFTDDLDTPEFDDKE